MRLDDDGGCQVDGEITSTQNSRVKAARKLQNKKYRQSRQATLVESIKTATAALQAQVPLEILFGTPAFLQQNGDFISRLRSQNTPVFSVNEEIVESISTVATPQGMVGVVEQPIWDDEAVLRRVKKSVSRWGGAVILWLDRISDPGNLGAMIRTAHALGAGAYLCAEGTVETFNPRVVRASAGSCFSLPGLRNISLIQARELLSGGSLCVVASSPRAVLELKDFVPAERTLLVLGEEGEGISSQTENAADVTLSIPMVEDAESLNVAAACSIMLYSLSPFS